MDVRNIGPLNQVLNPEKNNILKKSNPNTALDETSNLAETWRIINSMEKGLRNQRGTGAAALLNQFRRLERCATDKWLSRMILYPIMGLAFALALILQFVAPSLSINPLKKTCPLGYESLPLLVFLGIFLTVICPILVFLLYDINDAYGVKNELMVTLISGGLSYIGFFIIEKVIPEIGKYFGSYMFAWVSFTICHTLSITFPVLNSFAGNKKAHVNSKISRVSSFGSASDSNSKKYANFMDVLGNSEQFSRYKEFSAACFCTELILFLEEYQFLKIRVAQCCDPQLSQKKEVEVQEPDPLYIQDMKNHLLFSDMAHIFRSAPISPSLISTPCTISIAETISAARWIPFPTHELQSDYLMFYGMFFDQTSDLAINLRGSTLSTVKAMIDKDMFEITMFETARQEVLALLYQNTFDRFLKIYGVSFGERKV
ncbi:hypothetical protein G9A89_020108 [Geosiphon pyriformis]|nr:hypothetical protein G9A89_020108 [Geosiphon pyriformis]